MEWRTTSATVLSVTKVVTGGCGCKEWKLYEFPPGT